MKTPFSSTLSLNKSDNSQIRSMNVIDEMKKLVKSSNKDLEELFAEYDTLKTGLVSNLEFRNVMRKLNIGLSTYDIDSVLNVCQSGKSGTINWAEFCSKIKQKYYNNFIFIVFQIIFTNYQRLWYPSCEQSKVETRKDQEWYLSISPLT